MTRIGTTEARDLIQRALEVNAIECRKIAAGRKMAGPANAAGRKQLREEADKSMSLVILVGRAHPSQLANALWGSGR